MVVFAEDLPIDITAIGQQETGLNSTITRRFGTHLFTADAQRVNEAMEVQVQRRQEIVLYLFGTIPFDYTIDENMHITNAVNNSALFAEPLDFSRITLPAEAEPLPIWIIALILAVCSIGGFVWALTSRARKKEREANVH